MNRGKIARSICAVGGADQSRISGRLQRVSALGALLALAAAGLPAHAAPTTGVASISYVGDRTVKIHTKSGDYIAFDRGVENVWVGTAREFTRWNVSRLVPNLSPRASSIMTEMLGDGAPIPQQPGGWNEIAMVSPGFMLLAHPEQSGRPRISSNLRYVNVSWPGGSLPTVFFVDLVNGATVRPYASEKVDEWSSIDFAVPASSVAHRAMFIFVHGGKPMALAIKSVAWTTYRSYKTGHDVSKAEAQALLALDPSLPRLVNARDIDENRIRELQRRNNMRTVVQASPPSPPSAARAEPTMLLAAPNANLHLFVFRSQAEQERGLVGRPIGEHMGGLFVYPEDATHALWMKGMTVPLDFVFVARDGTITGVVTLPSPPAGAPDAEIPSIHGFGSYVVALPAGEAVADGLVQGALLSGLPRMSTHL